MHFKVLLTIAIATTLFACTVMTEQPESVEQEPVDSVSVNTWLQKRSELIAGLREDPHLSVQIIDDNMLSIQIRSGDSFNSSSNMPSLTLTRVLDHIASVLNASGAYGIKVVGHTDNIGAPEFNLKLSTDRALNVRQYLINKIKETFVSAVGKGAESPIVSYQSSEGRDVNRRIELLVWPWQK
jgi:outer membrane protein OmpA-like peptidoglycan-associated protein